MKYPGSTPATSLAAAIGLILTTVVWTWWAIEEGAYFGAVMYPGLVILCVGLILIGRRATWDKPVTLSNPTMVALGGLLALGTWSALSAIWSPAPDVAIADAQRIFGYAIAFALGIWVRVLLRERTELAMAPLALGGLCAGAYTVAILLTSDNFAQYVDRGTLQLPLGYRNANAAFFIIAMLPSVLLAASRTLDWRLRGLALASATTCLQLALLSQSRGSVLGAAVALAVLPIVSRERARTFAWISLAIFPALVVIPSMTDLFATAEIDGYAGTLELRTAGRAVLGGALIALTVGALGALAGRRVEPSKEREALANRVVGLGAIGLAAATLIVFVVATGDPSRWIENRVDEFFTQGTPDEGRIASRFEVNAGSERDDFWQVAIDVSKDHPLLGTGGGGFHYSYLRQRGEEGVESVQDAHSIELELLSELGIPGLALFIMVVTAAFIGTWQSRGPSRQEAVLAACALTVGAYWLAHASLDWFWPYAGVTAPVFALLGSAAARPSESASTGSSIRLRPLIAAAACALAISVVPPYLSDRYVDAAYASWRTDLEKAQSDLERARALNPLTVDPWMAEGAIMRAAGRDEAAVKAFERAASQRPEEWAAYYFLAVLNLPKNPGEAREALERALELNPLSADLRELEGRVAHAED